MDYILERTIDAKKGGEQFNFNPGRVSGMRLVLSGKNKTGETGTLADLGSVIVRRNSRQIANVSIESLAEMLDINGGSNLFSSTTAAAFLASAPLDFYLRNDVTMRNALNVVGQSELNFEYVPAASTDATFDTLQLKVYSERAAWNEIYELHTLRDNQNEDGAVASKSYQISQQNIAALYLRDPDSIIELVQLTQGERSVLSPVDWNLLESVTSSSNQIEDGTAAMVKIPTYSSGNPNSAFNSDTVLYLTTSNGGALPIVTQSISWS